MKQRHFADMSSLAVNAQLDDDVFEAALERQPAGDGSVFICNGTDDEVARILAELGPEGPRHTQISLDEFYEQQRRRGYQARADSETESEDLDFESPRGFLPSSSVPGLDDPDALLRELRHKDPALAADLEQQCVLSTCIRCRIAKLLRSRPCSAAGLSLCCFDAG